MDQLSDSPAGVAIGGYAERSAPYLVAGLAVVLQRRTERNRLTIGLVTPAGGPVAVTLDLSDDPAFRELIGRVERALGMANGGMANGGPANVAAAATAELDAVIGLDVEPPTAHASPIWLAASTEQDDIALELAAPARSDERATRGLLSQLRTVLDHATRGPGQPISTLSLLGPAELAQLLVAWNATEAPYPRLSLPDLLARQPHHASAREAVACGTQRITFAELDARANQLAHHLRGLGVGPDVLVGIAVERSVEMLVGLLGILKAGGAYVPVDPGYPTERQQFMLANSQASVVVTQASLLDALRHDGVQIVCVDRDWPAIATQPAQAPQYASSPEQLAYTIYTSGSTGQPKGVQIPHRALVNFLVSMARTPGLSADDVLVAVTTLSFDIAGLELYLPLLVGARLVIAPAQTAADPRALAQLLDDSDATVMQATPTTWRMLLDCGWRPKRAMKALCGGEPLPVALSDRLVGAGLELWNMYGPTETTIWSTCTRVTTRGESLTIGRPIANTTLYILDAAMRPVPVGIAGELWIGGDGLARGYRGRPDLTDERFVAHPFDAAEGARIYRTGDLARYRPDGEVEFLGRIDNQVKVRGFRIELGEIETVLTRHPGVDQAVVVARGAGDREAELAAYMVPTDGSVAAGALRDFAARTLPAYMVPTTFTTLDAFPLTPNGKIDRKALPEPVRERAAQRDLVAPRTALERRLAAIWERELAITPIGVTDDFFDLGVTSIVAARLFAAIEHELGSELPLGAIFRAPTIERLAAMVQEQPGQSRWTSLVPVQPAGSQPPIFCVHGGAGTILHLAGLARRLGADQPFYALQSRGLYGGAAPLRRVPEMAAFYLREMREVHRGGPWRLAGYCFGSLVAFEMAKMLTAQGEHVELLAAINGPSPSWIKQYGWYGNQPEYQARHGQPSQPTVVQRKRSKRARRVKTVLMLVRRVPRAVREPRKITNSMMWYGRRPLTRTLLRLGRPVPERLREAFFLELHAEAELAYDPAPYDGEMLVFYGDGLYEDPTLGWDGLARGGLHVFAVPGEHENNRQAMAEPGAAFVAKCLQESLQGAPRPGTPPTLSRGPGTCASHRTPLPSAQRRR